MADFQITRLMRDNGFELSRQARHGELWSDGLTEILIGGNTNKDNLKWVKRDVAKAVAKRKGEEARKAYADARSSDPLIIQRESVARQPLKASIGEVIKEHFDREDRLTPKGIVPPPTGLIELAKTRIAVNQEIKTDFTLKAGNAMHMSVKSKDPLPDAKPAVVKYDNVTRGRALLVVAVAEMWEKTQNRAMILAKLQELGFKTPDGKAPISQQNVGTLLTSFFHGRGARGTAPHPVASNLPRPNPATSQAQTNTDELQRERNSHQATLLKLAEIQRKYDAAGKDLDLAKKARDTVFAQVENARTELQLSTIALQTAKGNLLDLEKSRDYWKQQFEELSIAAREATEVTKTVTAIPEAVLSILTDPSLAADKKVRMVMAYVE